MNQHTHVYMFPYYCGKLRARRMSAQYAKSVGVFFGEEVLLARDRRVSVWAETWDSPRSVGITSPEPSAFGKDIRDTVADFADQFINDYLAANPK